MLMIYYFLFGTAFFTGFVGSLHCVAMCGPIALALPIGHFSGSKKQLALFIYHLGRITTYASLGLVAGLIGHSIHFLGFQQLLMVGTGLVLLLFALPFEKFKLQGAMQPIFKIKQAFLRQFKFQSMGHLFQLGMLNGLLPCGTVYLALAASLVVANPLISSLFMAVFGIGTIPIFALISFSFQYIPNKIKSRFSQFSPLIAVLFGLFFIAKGVNLNIPYLSPQIVTNANKTTLVCH